jgi:hypothetical protein
LRMSIILSHPLRLVFPGSNYKLESFFTRVGSRQIVHYAAKATITLAREH